VIYVVGAQKLVATPEEARNRIFEHSLMLEDAASSTASPPNSLTRQSHHL
jgi:hypothetical protein